MPGTHMVEEGPESCKLWSDLQGMNIYTHTEGGGRDYAHMGMAN